MADLTFSQPARRNLLVPVALAVIVLVALVYAVLRLTPHTTAEVVVTNTTVYPSHLVYKSNSIVLNSDQVQDDLYILPTLRITNRLRLPLFLKDFRASLSPGAENAGAVLHDSAVEKPDLTNLLTTLAPLGKLAARQTAQPLYRETRIDPGQTVEGYIILHFPGTQALWDKRQGVSIIIDLYHQQPLTVEIPNNPQP